MSARTIDLVTEVGMAMPQSNAITIEEHEHGGTVWIAIRARGAEWSWLTREEAAQVGRDLIERYGRAQPRPVPVLAAE